jgi:16S rRNA (guanine1207-N2)-methyltransferase
LSHYYENDPNLRSKIQKIDVNIKNTSFQLYTDIGVFSKDTLDLGTKTLIETVEISDNDKHLIDMGSGYGPIGIYFAKIYPNLKVSMFDINERAIELANKNIELNNLKNIKATISDLFQNNKTKADVILTNPPIRAGKKTVFNLYEEAHSNLKEDGRLYVVINRKHGAPSSFKKLEEIFSFVETITKNKGYWIILAKK